MKRYLIGIDNGGTRTKAAVFDTRGVEVAAISRRTPMSSPREGYNERDMLLLWEETAAAVRLAIQKADIPPDRIVGIGCCGHGKGLYPWGDGRPAYRGIASSDRRAGEIVQRWKTDGTAGKALPRICQPVIECQPAALLAWLKANEPEAYKAVRWVFEAKDFIRFMLTGEAYAEVTDFSGTGLMNLVTGRFDDDILDIFGIQEMKQALPPLRLSSDLCGTVSETAALQTGIPAGTPVCGGMFDIDACAVAMDLTDEDKLGVITGTWSINEYIARAPVPPNGTARNSLFVIPGYYLIEESSPTSAGNLEWFIDRFMADEKLKAARAGSSVYAVVDAMMDGVSPGDSAVLFLPFLYGTHDSACPSAAFAGLNDTHTTRHLLQAVFEGVVFAHMTHMEKLLTRRSPPEKIRLAGGVTNSVSWVQMFADATGFPVEVIRTRELGCLGAAMAAAVSVGIYPDYACAAGGMVSVETVLYPNAERHDLYQKKFARYKKLVSILGGLK